MRWLQAAVLESTTESLDPHVSPDIARMGAAYVPLGTPELAEELRGELHPRAGDATIDLLDKLATRPQGVPILRSWAAERYGRVGGRGAQAYTWDSVRAALEARGVIFEWPGYVVGGRAKKYGLGAAWRARPLIRVSNPLTRPTAPQRGRGTQQRQQACPVPVPAWLATQALGADLNLAAATQHLLEAAGMTVESAQALVATSSFNSISEAVAEVAGSVTATEVMYRLLPAWRWKVDGRVWVSRDPSGWRVHTQVSSLSSRLRRFLKFPGRGPEPLVEIDATNSQAVFLARVANQALACAETREFADVCGRGLFYEETFNAVHNRPPTFAERAEWKERVMALWLYADLTCQVGCSVGKALGARFPQLHCWMADLKAKKGTAFLPCQMQRAEAHVWIDSLMPRLEHLRIPVLSVHDCIIIPAEFADSAAEAVSATYAHESLTARVVRKVTH